MPKLPTKAAKAVDETEAATGFAPIPPGLYQAFLREVKVKDGPNGPYWVWEFEIVDGEEYAGRRFWNNTSLSEKSRPFMKAVFDAFGVPADTNTDELCGCIVTLQIGNRTRTDTKELTNTIKGVLAYDPDADDDGDDDDEDGDED
jgi:hypothetical protein